jgi:CRP/FNR family transcriptional regulator
MEFFESSPVEILSRCPLFEGVSRSDLGSLAAQCEWLELGKRQPLFFQGDPVKRLYLVVEGLIKVYRLDPKGERQIVIHLDEPGQWVAAVAVFMHQPHYPASAEAAEASRVLAIPASEFYQLIQQNITLSNSMLRFTAQRTRQIVQVLDRMVFREVDSRLAEYLLSMAQAHGQGFKLPTNPEIAAIVGTTPEPVSRKLGHFSMKGWVEINRRRVHITNPVALQELAQAT